MVPGLFLALLAAFFVLAANNHWLFPALDRTGVLYLATAPELARGAPPEVPVAPWNAAEPVTGLQGQGTLMPLLMAGLVRAGARPHVAGLWLMAASLAVAVFALSWAVGGVAGIAGAVGAGLMLIAAPLTRDASTILGPDTLLAALVAVLVGVMTYQPRWWPLQGAVAAAAWLAHPAGVGAVAAVAVWAGVRGGTGGRRGAAVAAALAPAVLLLAVGVVHPLLSPRAAAGGGWGAAILGVLRWAVWGRGGLIAAVAGLAVLGAGGLLVAVEALSTPDPPARVHWSDPAAPDVLARSFRPAAGLLALGTLLGASWAGGSGDLDRPWLPTTLLLGSLGAAAAFRWARRGTRDRKARTWGTWAPAVLVALWVAVGSWGSWRGLARMRAEGRGVTAGVWVESPVIRWVDNRSRGWSTLYATDPMLVYLQTGRGALGLPEPGSARLDAFVQAWRTRPGPLVITGDAPQAWIDDLTRRLDLVEAVHAGEGRILVPEDGPPPASGKPMGRGEPGPGTEDRPLEPSPAPGRHAT